MQMIYSRNPWSYSMDFNLMIDFCIWTLQVDGLHVPPFDQHPDGDGSLRAAGLTSNDWQSWLLHVIYQDGEQKRSRQQQAQVDPFNPRFLEPLNPPAIWHGNDAVRERLIELWKLYRPVSKGEEIAFSRALRKAEQKSGKRLYDELRPYHTRLPPLSIYLTAYEWPLDYLISPAILLMTIQDGQPDPAEFRERVLTAAVELVTRRGRGKQSPYSKLAESSGQCNVVYRSYARKPVPFAPFQQKMPRLDHPIRQIVLERLVEPSAIYGIVDLTTVQFLREKTRSGWKLYEVTFHEIDGEQHRLTIMLQQQADGAWRQVSSGTSSDIPNQWFKHIAPVRDHPLIFLDVGWRLQPQLLRHAHGYVIDNGFHVKRVRLINDAGQFLEDTVEDGYVFFACEPEQPMQLPMQAELYDHQDKLVWRQTVSALPAR